MPYIFFKLFPCSFVPSIFVVKYETMQTNLNQFLLIDTAGCGGQKALHHMSSTERGLSVTFHTGKVTQIEQSSSLLLQSLSPAVVNVCNNPACIGMQVLLSAYKCY